MNNTKKREIGFNVKIESRKLELKHAWTISRNTSNFKDNVFVTLEKDGILGFGEAAHNVRYGESRASTIDTIKMAIPLLETCNPFDFVATNDSIRQLCEGQTAAKCAIDMALMDWVTKSLNIPLFKYLGLNPQKTPQTSFSIGIDNVELIKQKVQEAGQYPLLKIKLGSENDEQILAAVRSVTNKTLRVDANEAWKDVAIAREKIDWLAENNVEFVEQPMPVHMYAETAKLREKSPLPLFADEAFLSSTDIPKLVGVYDGINIKLDKAGGIQEALKMIHLAHALGLKIMLGCMVSSSLSITAAAHLSPLVDYADLDGNLLIKNDPFQGVNVRDGWLKLPQGNGLGVSAGCF